MELNHQEIKTPPRDAASVLMLRDGTDGLEIFMLQRHSNSAVLGGAYVFPGGKLDAADAELDPERHLDQPRDLLHRQLAEPELDAARACGLYVAALREAFEESGILFAHGPQGQAPDATSAGERLRAGTSFADVLRDMSLQLTTRLMQTMDRAADQPVGTVANAVMFHAQLHKGLRLLKVIAMAASLGQRISSEDKSTDIFEWRDAGGDSVQCHFLEGRLQQWALVRANPETLPQDAT